MSTTTLHRRTKSDFIPTYPSAYTPPVNFPTHDLSGLLSRMAHLEADLKEAIQKRSVTKETGSPDNLDHIKGNHAFLKSTRAMHTMALAETSMEVDIEMIDILLSLPLMRNIIDVVKKSIDSENPEILQKNILIELSTAIFDSNSPWHQLKIMTHTRSPAILRTQDHYFAAIDIALSARKNTRNYKKLAKFWKNLAIDQQDSSTDIPLTPSPSDISDTGLNEIFDSPRKKRLAELVEARRLSLPESHISTDGGTSDAESSSSSALNSGLLQPNIYAVHPISTTSKFNRGKQGAKCSAVRSSKVEETTNQEGDVVDHPLKGEIVMKSRLKPKSPPFTRSTALRTSYTPKHLISSSLSRDGTPKSRSICINPLLNMKDPPNELVPVRPTSVLPSSIESNFAPKKNIQCRSLCSQALDRGLELKSQRISEKLSATLHQNAVWRPNHKFRTLNSQQGHRTLGSPINERASLNQKFAKTPHAHCSRNCIATM